MVTIDEHVFAEPAPVAVFAARLAMSAKLAFVDVTMSERFRRDADKRMRLVVTAAVLD
jgi:hypothetical protein